MYQSIGISPRVSKKYIPRVTKHERFRLKQLLHKVRET